jgi:hypothetical protein
MGCGQNMFTDWGAIGLLGRMVRIHTQIQVTVDMPAHDAF